MPAKLDMSKKVFGKCTFPGGVHPPHRKLTEGLAVERVSLTPGHDVVIPMVQHIGAPCKPVVAPKQEVKAGEVIGRADAFVSAPVHSPCNGVVKSIIPLFHPSGRKIESVVITVGEEQPEPKPWQEFPADFDLNGVSPETIAQVSDNCGLVGAGGAAFPTRVKLVANPSKPIDIVLLNGCECEPYLTSDHRLMLESPLSIITGLRLAMRAVGAAKGIIAIEDNKQDAINKMFDLVKKIDGLHIAVCKTKYPQGGEKQLIRAVTGREVPLWGLPMDIGVMVSNVGTASTLAWSCYDGRVFNERIVTVTGKGVNRPGNYMVPVGMKVEDLLAHCGGIKGNVAKILLGGPMMGSTAYRLDVPVMKGTSGITVMTDDEYRLLDETACIRCSRCVDNCPVRLLPTTIAHAVKARDIQKAVDNHITACIECGCCSYVCPAQIPLVQYIRAGKVKARELKK